MKELFKAIFEDIKMNFKDYGIKFLPKFLIAPFVLLVFVVGMLLHDLVVYGIGDC